jgi:cation transport ATPase
MSCVAMAFPRLGWPTFFEEPAMLMGVVLLGKTLEERAKLAASSDMASLQVGSRAARVSNCFVQSMPVEGSHHIYLCEFV